LYYIIAIVFSFNMKKFTPLSKLAVFVISEVSTIFWVSQLTCGYVT
jgi:hypothetical protein